MKDLDMGIPFKHCSLNGPGTNFQLAGHFPFLLLKHPSPAPFPCIPVKQMCPALPRGAPPPHPAQPGLAEGEVGSVQNWLTLYWAALLILHDDYWPSPQPIAWGQSVCGWKEELTGCRQCQTDSTCCSLHGPSICAGSPDGSDCKASAYSASWETCMQVRKQQLELDKEQTGSK